MCQVQLVSSILFWMVPLVSTEFWLPGTFQNQNQCTFGRMFRVNNKVYALKMLLLNFLLIDFRKRFVSLLSFQFSSFQSSTALQVLQGKKVTYNKLLSALPSQKLSKAEMDMYFTPYDLQRLDVYSKNMADYHIIMDLVPSLAKLFFLGKTDCSLSIAQKVRSRFDN